MNHKKELIEVLRKAAADPGLLEDFLRDLLTPGEYEEIATRWQIVKRLAKGENQRAIAKDLHIGIATVTRGNRELINHSGGFAQMVRKIKLD